MTRGEHPGRDRDRTRERDHGRLSTQRDLRYRAMSWLTPDLPEVPSPCQPPRATPLDNTGDPLTTWPFAPCARKGVALGRRRGLKLAAREMKVSWPFGAALRGEASSHRMVP